MYDGLTKVFWGIFIATFNINLGPVKILPAFVGFMVISSGINAINNNYPIDVFYRALDFSRILVAISLLGGLIDFFIQRNYQHSILLQIWPIILMTLELIMFFNLFMGFIQYLNSMGKLNVAERYIGSCRTYIIVFIINITIISFGMLFNLVGLNTISAIVFIILRISLMVMTSGLKKELIPDNPEEDQGI